MSRQTLCKRVTLLERQTTRRVSKELIAQLAADIGCTPEELLAEAEEIARQFQEAGAVTWEQQVAIVARQHNITADEVMVDLAAMGMVSWR
jgi:hypothetical protein